MDAVVHSALEEICCEAAQGLRLRDLWPKLSATFASRGLSLCPNVKRAIWENLVEIPGIKVESCDGNTSSNSTKDLINFTVEECEKLNAKIVAPEAMRRSFLGLYEMDAPESSVTSTQRVILERLAVARTNGIAQNDLTKELGLPANKLFYQLKGLETRELIVRQPTVIKKKQASNNGIVSTNMLYLYRFAKHLGCQQRLEIIKEDNLLTNREAAENHLETSDDLGKEYAKEDVNVKDFLPPLKAICDELEKARGKVLVVSDLKRALGYQGVSGHRSWRNICHRLKDAQVVEECRTIINNKEADCLRLLQSFSPSLFEPKRHGLKHDDANMEQSIILLKRGQITEQLVELPIFRQIYDMIDAAGSKGLTNIEVWKRFGLCCKEYHNRYFKQLICRFGLHAQLESHNRSEAYRVWTDNNFNNKSSKMLSLVKETVVQEVNLSTSHVGMDSHENFSLPHQVLGTPTPMGSDRGMDKTEHDEVGITAATNSTTIEEDASNAMLLECNPQNSDEQVRNDGHDEELNVNKVVTSSDMPEMGSLVVAQPSSCHSDLRWSRPAMRATSSLREQRILEMLQEEKFLIKPELHKHLESLEKEKRTAMDRKTLDRILNKLQQDGHCKCIHVSVPVLTNCGRNRTTEVVLHPSVWNVSPELLTQIHEKMRSFEIRVRKQAHAKQKGQSVPILDRVERIPGAIRIDCQAERYELMRSNGYVPAKMVRVKLLHIFLWGWICNDAGLDDASLSSNNSYDLKNPHSTCKLFKPDLAVRSLPLELFLQVVGSIKQIDDMVERCRSGTLLCDLPKEEYKGLMDTRATGLLSELIAILTRLKLIRLVSKDHADAGVSSQHTTLTYALELKPYIEEPVSVASSGFIFPDMRPRVRHDFVLSCRKAVDEYWNTLEYCYATAQSRAALLAFPGSAVHEVFHSRAWACARVMRAEQRAKLLKRLENDDPNKKLSFSECKEIAKDLNLTMEQVLRVHYDKRQKQASRFQGVSDAKEHGPRTVKGKHNRSSRKRKHCSDKISSKLAESSIGNGQSRVEGAALFLDSDNQFAQDQYTLRATTEDYDQQLQKYYAGDYMECPDKQNLNEIEISTLIQKQVSSSSARLKRFSWTEESDRQLIMEYAKYRAALGPKFHRVAWSSVSNLPAPPDVCRRRMALLMDRYKPFRKAVLRLCNMLAECYTKYIGKFQDKDGASVEMRRDPVNQEDDLFSPDSMYEEWADFDEQTIKAALDDVLRYKKMIKLAAMHSTLPDHGNSDSDDLEDGSGTKTYSQRSRTHSLRSRARRLPVNYTKLLNGCTNVRKQMHESVAIANAAELFKLIFLSRSKAPEVPTLLAETLRRYSEHDLFAAFSYLREKKIMIGGTSNCPFVLSLQFLQTMSSSVFPTDTGKRAAKFARWLDKREQNLMEVGIEVPSYVQCGEALTVCALVSSGELSITPCLPNEGVGEVEDTRTSKRKCDSNELDGGEIFKKLKTSFAGEGEIISRREKGFPGMKVLLHRKTFPSTFSIESFRGGNMCLTTPLFGGKDPSNTVSGLDLNCTPFAFSDCESEILDSGGVTHPAIDVNESPWDAMTGYSKCLMPSCSHEVSSFLLPQQFKTLYSAIQKSGDNGLSMKDIHKVLHIEDDRILEVMIEVLETFGRVLKVNGYNAIHVVDSLYQSKYFLTRVHDPITHLKSREKENKDGHMPLNIDNQREGVGAMENEISSNADKVHRVTILNLPEVVADAPTETSQDKFAGHQQADVAPPESNIGRTFQSRSPLLPWMNGDGTINEVVYKGLIRRVLGIVMQNPGILEDEIINRMQVLNPQSCRQLLEILMMDKHIVTRKMQQMTSHQPPSILGNLLGKKLKKSKLVCRVHYFANPTCSNML